MNVGEMSKSARIQVGRPDGTGGPHKNPAAADIRKLGCQATPVMKGQRI